MRSLRFFTGLIAGLMLLFASAVRAQSTDVREFYSGRTITFYIGFPAGAAYDLYARLLGRHIARHVPGIPKIVMSNMPAASSLVLANTLVNVSPRDGSVFGAVFERVGLEPLVNPQNARFDGRELTWIGSLLKVTDVCMLWHESPAKTLEDAKRRVVVVGASATSGGSALEARVLNVFVGTKFKIVPGYGGPELFLAMERGETEGRCGMSWGGLKAARPEWLAQKKVAVVVQLALTANPELSGVPLIMDQVADPDDIAALAYLYGTQDMGRPYAAPPGIPADRKQALRAAFDHTIVDAEFLADAARSNLEVSPISGAEVEAIMARLYATSRPIIERVETLRNPPASTP